MFIKNFFRFLAAVVLLPGFASLGLAADTDKDAGQQTAAPVAKPMPLYKPPSRGAPASRVGGGTRGLAGDRPTLVVLAPDHTGLTVLEQPTLYWYLSKPARMRLEISIINDEAIDPVLEETISSPKAAGIQSYNLANNDIKLKTGVEYRWFVALVPDETQRSNDIIAGGTIMRVNEDPAMKEKLAASKSMSDKAIILAENSIWYDAIDAISTAIEEQDSPQLHEIRAAMLEQVGLKDVAEEDRN